MENVTKGQLVKFELDGQEVAGVVDGEQRFAFGGDTASVALLPQFSHLAPLGSVNARVADLRQG
ncbi:hypothetical protein SEA_GALACTICA_109 [Streptomyces phage Galactica]|nr:hypothetical protein SEA_GALACTICA_109 [Streptomyces phage Galactica]